MRIVFQIPVKARTSARVPNKNFRDLNGRPLFAWLIDEILKLKLRELEFDIFVDSEDISAFENITGYYCGEKRIQFHQRDPWLAEDHANGNHLLAHFAVHKPTYDIYIQAFITAVTLRREIIGASIKSFTQNLNNHDSMFLVTEEPGWVWYQGKAVNYDPTRMAGLPRSQDAMYFKETTGLYAITKDALMQGGCRIGNTPMLYAVDRFSSVDIDTMEDLHEAEEILGREARLR
ncbi:MAG: cytidylyltransferase domain-containing protein [Opitutales bacterium]